MIRQYDEYDIDALMKIWLDTNIQAHNFISSDYWRSNYDMVRNINEESNFIKKSRIHEVIDEVKRKGYSIQELNDLKSYINFEEENKKIK